MIRVRRVGGWRYVALVGLIGAAIYPIIIDPYLNQDRWQNIQRDAKQDIDTEKIQPGGMKEWTNPFDKKKSS